MKDYYSKYLKYKQKYITAKYIGGMTPRELEEKPATEREAELDKMKFPEQVLNEMTQAKAAETLENVSNVKAANFLTAMQENHAAAVLALMAPEKKRNALNQISNRKKKKR